MTRSPLRALGMSLYHCRVAVMYAAAYVWRTLLIRTRFVAVTGSVGKTTAKECLAAALASRYPTIKSAGNQNGYDGVPRSILRVRPWHRFAVIEVAANGRGIMKRSARLVRPDVAVVLLVARNHMKGFRTLENVAAEKALLVARLRPGGVAVLNGDDPRVAAMAASLRQRVVFFGSSPSCEYRADSASSTWPERFSFRLQAGAQRMEVRTRLVGRHWQSSVLSALATAHVCGVPLADAAAAVAEVEPTPARMQPALLPCGAVMIRDDYDGSADSFEPAFAAFAEARAARKVLIMSDVTDTSKSPRDRFRVMGRSIAAACDLAIFIGDRAGHGVRGAVAGGMDSGHARAFFSWPAAVDFLKSELTTGDLVLLRGRTGDHLARLYFALWGPVQCRKTQCRKQILCDVCAELGAPTPPPQIPIEGLHIAPQPPLGSRHAARAETHPKPAVRC